MESAITTALKANNQELLDNMDKKVDDAVGKLRNELKAEFSAMLASSQAPGSSVPAPATPDVSAFAGQAQSSASASAGNPSTGWSSFGPHAPNARQSANARATSAKRTRIDHHHDDEPMPATSRVASTPPFSGHSPPQQCGCLGCWFPPELVSQCPSQACPRGYSDHAKCDREQGCR